MLGVLLTLAVMTVMAGDYMFNNFTLSRVAPRAQEEEPSIVMVHNPQDPQDSPGDQPELPNVPHSSQAPLPLVFQPPKAPVKWLVRRRSSVDIRSGQVRSGQYLIKIFHFL